MIFLPVNLQFATLFKTNKSFQDTTQYGLIPYNPDNFIGNSRKNSEKKKKKNRANFNFFIAIIHLFIFFFFRATLAQWGAREIDKVECIVIPRFWRVLGFAYIVIRRAHLAELITHCAKNNEKKKNKKRKTWDFFFFCPIFFCFA